MSQSQIIQIQDAPVVFLCGGKGMYIDGSGERKLKCLIEIDHQPILFHLIRSYVKAGFRKFILSGGYQLDRLNQFIKSKAVSQNPEKMTYSWEIEGQRCEFAVVDTGMDTSTGERIIRIKSQLNNAPVFCVTYSDTLSDLDLNKLFQYHLRHKKIATLVATRMPTRFRVLGLRYGDDLVRGFAEKAVIQTDLINGGYYVFNNEIWSEKYLGRNSEGPVALETSILEELSKNQQLVSYKIKSKWQHLDSERDLSPLTEIAKQI